jgi:hypothetical protein
MYIYSYILSSLALEPTQRRVLWELGLISRMQKARAWSYTPTFIALRLRMSTPVLIHTHMPLWFAEKNVIAFHILYYIILHRQFVPLCKFKAQKCSLVL